MNGVEFTTSERDLGVLYSEDLKWKNHIIKCESKANSIWGMIKRSSVTFEIKIIANSLHDFC